MRVWIGRLRLAELLDVTRSQLEILLTFVNENLHVKIRVTHVGIQVLLFDGSGISFWICWNRSRYLPRFFLALLLATLEFSVRMD